MNKIKELTRRIEILENFKEEYDIKMFEEEADKKSKELSRIFKLKIIINITKLNGKYSVFLNFPNMYVNRLYINDEIIYESKKYDTIKETCENINYGLLTDKIKAYVYDNKTKNKVGRPKKGSSK